MTLYFEITVCTSRIFLRILIDLGWREILTAESSNVNSKPGLLCFHSRGQVWIWKETKQGLSVFTAQLVASTKHKQAAKGPSMSGFLFFSFFFLKHENQRRNSQLLEETEPGQGRSCITRVQRLTDLVPYISWPTNNGIKSADSWRWQYPTEFSWRLVLKLKLRLN